MKRILLLFVFALTLLPGAYAQDTANLHPDTSGPAWMDLFTPDLSNALYPEGIWSVTDGVLTATEDQAIWSEQTYDDFIIDLDFMTAEGTNSGVIIYTSDIDNWIPNSVEIQIADDYAEQWATSPPTWQCGAFFGHKAADQHTVKKPGEWNRFTITARGPILTVVLNGEQVNEMDLRQWTSATTNPDGSEIPSWLSKPWAELPTHGRIGFQGKHAGAPIYFRNIRIKKL